MARLSRLHLVAATSVPIAIVLISLGLVAYRKREVKPVDPPQAVETEDPSSPDSKDGDGRPRLAITPEQFDDMGQLLDDMGEAYVHETIEEQLIRDPKAASKYQTIFLTCAEPGSEAENQSLGKGLRDFVSSGGTLYASDLRFDAVAAAFPEFVDPGSVAQGLHQDIRSTIASAEMRSAIGAEILLHFELDGWRPAAFRGDEVDVLIKGKLKTTAGVMIEAPLLVKFPFGKGTVIFTSFHAEKKKSSKKKNSEKEIKLLTLLALKTVLARLESREVDTLAGDGLVPQVMTAISADSAAEPKTIRYELAKAGPIQFRLGFEGTGAQMCLEVKSPKGEKTVKRGESTVAIDIPEAAPGRWEYRLVAEEVPYEGFPAVLIVATNDRATGSVKERANPALAELGGNVEFEEVSLGNKPVSTTRQPRLAVSDPYKYDDMGKLLRSLGKGYRYESVTMNDLLRQDALDNVDIFFLTCDNWPDEWLVAESAGLLQLFGVSPPRTDPDPRKVTQACQTIRRFVERGGTLYASDWRYKVLENVYPERKAPKPLNEKLVPELMEAERKWLAAKAPTAQVEPIDETLRNAGLSPELTAKLDRLVVAVESSNLVRGDLTEKGVKPEVMIRRVLKEANLPSKEEDISALSRALVSWESAIIRSVRGRSAKAAAKAQFEINQAQGQLNRVRSRISQNGLGKEQKLTADVADPGLREMLGSSQIQLDFNLNNWFPARFRGDDVAVLIRSEYTTTHGVDIEAPLLVKFPEGQGTVIFTSFHNETQTSEKEEILLRYLVFTAITAQEEARADKTMLSGGFSTAKRNQINHMAGNATITKTYVSTSSDPLRFALIFNGADAQLKFTLVAPNGQKHIKEVESTLVVEAKGAPPGEWTYTVEAVKVPYENFPFGVSIGKGDNITGAR
jgi:hypothetical protein